MKRAARVIPLMLAGMYIVLLVRYLPELLFDNTLERWVASESKEIIAYSDFLNNFGGDAFLIAALEVPDNLSFDQFEKELLPVIKDIQNLTSVTSLSTWPIPLLTRKKLPPENVRCYLISFSPHSHLNPNRPELLVSISKRLEKETFKWHLAGTGVIYEAINSQTKSSIQIFLSTGLLILFSLLFLMLRKPMALFLSVGVSVCGVVSLLLVAAVFDIPLSIANSVLPILILFYGTSTSLHILFHGGDFRLVLIPCLIAALTTLAGFLVFFADPIPLLHDFAILAIAGILGGLIWSIILFFPGFYTYRPSPGLLGFFERIKIPTHPSILLAFLIVIIFMVPGIVRLKPNIYSLSVLPADNKAVTDHFFVEQHIGNYFPLEFVVDADQVDPVEVYDWITSVYELKEIDGVISYLSFLPYGNPRLHGYRGKDHEMARITFLAPLMSTSEGLLLVDKIDVLARQNFVEPPPTVTGFVTLYGGLADNLGKSFIHSLLLAFLVIFSILLLFLRDVKLFIASILPNVFPIVVILGLMGWLHIPLDMITVPIGCLLLSIIVDDTIHFLFWYKRTTDLRETFKKAGPGIVYTTMVLVTGFSVFLTSSAPPIRTFGILSVTALLSAMIADLVLLPVMLTMMKKSQVARH